ncbi:DUF3892 domain-containing protein [Sphingomonas cremea]|uniref:DUF3892 domain-containing protein n=1 Tax=Sphingomonas cremea TaxID=2904799 RepID=UPI0038B6790E
MAKHQITCVTLDGPDSNRTIDAVGGPQFGIWPIAKAIAWTKAGHGSWTNVNGNPAPVFRRGTPLTGEYLTTSPDGYLPNNLLKLTPCP